jgi:hypothetical protein
MKKIFAQLKNDQNVVVFDDADTDILRDVYKTPNVTLAIPFEVDTRALAEGEWYFIALTEEQKEEMLGGYVSESSTVMLSPITPDQYSEVRVLYQVSGEETLFTKVTSRQVSGAKKYITFNEKPVVTEQGNSLLFTGEVDAYWNGRFLYFKKFALVRPLFPGLHKVFKELTETVTNDFLSSAVFELKEEMSSDVIGLRNRKRIASIIGAKSIDLNDPLTYGKYITYAEQYNLDLEIESGKITLIDNSDINNVMNMLGETYYTTDVTGERREIGTSKKLVHGKRKRAR